MARKQDYIQSKATGEPLPPAPEVVPEMEQAEVQEAILNPEKFMLHLNDNTAVELPYVITLGDLLNRNRTLSGIRFFAYLLRSEIKKIRGTDELDINDPLFVGILYKPSMQIAMEELLSTATKKPIHAFEGKLDELGTLDCFRWVMEMLKKSVGSLKSGASEAKN